MHIRKKPQWRRCVACKSREVTREGQAAYTLRALPIGSKPVYLVLHLHVLRCGRCKQLLQESRDVADPRKSYTHAFGRLVVDLSRSMTMLALARFLRVGWDLVKEVIKAELERRKRRRSWRKVRRIGIDEIAIRKGHRYMTIVVDMDTGEVLFTAEGRDHECLQPFFVRLKRAGAKLKAIALDRSPSYLKAVPLYAPSDAIVVHDHYHVVAHMNVVVDEVRRDEQNQLEGEGKSDIKGSRYLLLGAKENIQKEPEKQARLDALLRINQTLHKVYLLKEDLRLFWSQDSKKEAKVFIEQWIETAKSMANTHVTRFAQTVEKSIDRIVAWYDHPITTGPLEGLNNKIKVLKRAAYGYRDMDFFGLRLLFLHETAFQLSGL